MEVTSTDTLSDVRGYILEDFDDEQLPSSSSSSSNEQDEGTNDKGSEDGVKKGNTDEFSFKVNGIRVSAKQEARKNAFDLLDRNVSVEIVSKQPPNKKRGVSSLDEGEGENNEIVSAKRTKMDGEFGHVTPFDSVSTSVTTSKSEEQLDGEDEMLDDNDKKGEEKNKDDNNNNNNDVDDSSTIATGDSSTLDPVQLDGKFATGDGDDKKRKEEVAPNNDKNDTKDDDSDATMELQLAMNSSNNDKKNGQLKKSDMDMELEGGDFENDGSIDIELEGDEDLMTTDKKKPAKAADNLNDDIDDIGTSFSNNDDNGDIFEVSNNEEEPPNDPHKESNIAKQKSKQVLKQLSTILTDNKDFCSDNRRKEWLDDVNTLLDKSNPQTVFGVLGNTGV